MAYCAKGNSSRHAAFDPCWCNLWSLPSAGLGRSMKSTNWGAARVLISPSRLKGNTQSYTYSREKDYQPTTCTLLRDKDDWTPTMICWETQHCPAIYSGAFHTVCMTARVKSHDSRYIGGQTCTRLLVTRSQSCGRGGGMWGVYWVDCDASRGLTPICCVSPSASPSVSV